MIHPTAIIHPRAKLDSTVEVGPYAVIDAEVEVGPRCHLGPQVYLTGQTVIGARNRFFAGAVIGEAPQDLKYDGAPTGLRIGDDNVFREHVTVHRATHPGEETVVGSHNFLMAHCHVGHNSQVASHVIIANGALLGGHASVADRAFISGNCLVHQFVRVGTLAMMQGGSAVSQDLPPYTMVRRVNELCGLNLVGLRRAGLTPAERVELKRLYRALFRQGQNLRAAAAAAAATFASAPAKVMLDFLAASKRGVCSELGKLRFDDEVESG
jgi:UDP-N-acetylglucosamine acyltransferase